MIADIFSIFTGIFKSIKAIGSLRNNTDPVLGLIDGLISCDDFTMVKHKPRKEDMIHKMIYFYRDNDKIYYINQYMDYNKPTEVKREDFIQFKDFKGGLVFDKITAIIDGKKSDLSILSKGAVYRFLLSKGKFTAGLKYAFHASILLPYRRFEKNFIAKHPKVYKVYTSLRKAFHKACIFTVSETGIRILGLTTAIGLAVISGGTFLAIAAGAYAAGVAFSITRQAINKRELNRLREEADLLEKYAITYKEKLSLAKQKNINFKDNHFKAPVKPQIPATGFKKWGRATYNYLSTYGLEVGVPVAAIALSPTHAVLQLSIIACSSAISSIVGVVAKKTEDEKKQLLRDAINDAKTHDFIPGYKHLAELREYAKLQENQLDALKLMGKDLNGAEAAKSFEKILKEIDNKIPPTFFYREYGRALFEVINPFDKSKEVKDSRDVSSAVRELSDAILANNLANKDLAKENLKNIINLQEKIILPGLEEMKLDSSNLPHKTFIHTKAGDSIETTRH